MTRAPIRARALGDQAMCRLLEPHASHRWLGYAVAFSIGLAICAAMRVLH